MRNGLISRVGLRAAVTALVCLCAVSVHAEPSTTTFQNAAVQLKFEYPSGWAVRKNDVSRADAPLYLTMEVKKEDKVLGGVAVIAFVNESLTPADANKAGIDSYLARVRRIAKKVTASDPVQVEMDGEMATNMRLSLVSTDGEPTAQSLYFVVHGGKAFMFYYSADALEFDSKPFEAMIHSVKWLAK